LPDQHTLPNQCLSQRHYDNKRLHLVRIADALPSSLVSTSLLHSQRTPLTAALRRWFSWNWKKVLNDGLWPNPFQQHPSQSLCHRAHLSHPNQPHDGPKQSTKQCLGSQHSNRGYGRVIIMRTKLLQEQHLPTFTLNQTKCTKEMTRVLTRQWSP